MKKIKRINRRFFRFSFAIRKRIFLISRNVKGIEVSEDSIRKMTKCMDKAKKMIDSCFYIEQLDAVECFVNLLYERYQYAAIINRSLLITVNDLRKGNKKNDILPLPTYEDYLCNIDSFNGLTIETQINNYINIKNN